MALRHLTRTQRRLTFGLVAIITTIALAIGIFAVGDDSGDPVETASTSARTPEGATPGTDNTDADEGGTTYAAEGDADTTDTAAADTTATEADATDDVVEPNAAEKDQPFTGSTQECRLDPSCPSSEHRTGDLCGAELIVDLDGYLEGSRDAKQGLGHQVDGAPTPDASDEDDDDATVGPQTRYRAGYEQGWCDGSAVQTPQ